MRLADRLIVASEASRLEVLGLGLPAPKLMLGGHGLDPARYPVSALPRENLVVTVCGVNRSNLRRKGLEAFVRTAAYCPDQRFVVVGAWMDDTIVRLRAMAQPNVRFTGWVSHNEKVAWLSRASVIMQPSLHEAFGLSVAEGMLCGAVPCSTQLSSAVSVSKVFGPRPPPQCCIPGTMKSRTCSPSFS